MIVKRSLALLISSIVLANWVTETKAEPLFAIRSDNSLIRVDSSAPQTILSSVAVTGLPDPTSRIKAIDFRPANRTLYAIVRRTDQTNSLYSLHTINLLTGAATQIGTNTFALNSGAETDVGMDFNPVVDRIRIVDSADENFRFNPDTADLVGTDTTLTYDVGDVNSSANPAISCIAYDNNSAGVTTTTVYGIDVALGTLARLGGVAGSTSPNGGILSTIGSTGATSLFNCGADFSSMSGSLYAALSTGSESNFISYLYRVGPSGLGTLAGTFGNSLLVRDVAAPIYETNLPTVTVDSTAARTTNRKITVTGTSSDDTLVDEVLYRRGAGLEWQVLEDPAAWTKQISLRNGRNRLQFKVRDVFGNESPVTIVTVRKNVAR